jgi:hypothetical protein
MLREITSVRQDSTTITRRWFQDDYFDLFLWADESRRVVRFQLCYDRQGRERVLLWSEDGGFRHQGVDVGEGSPVRNDAPIFVNDLSFQAGAVKLQFRQRAASLPQPLRLFLHDRLGDAERFFSARPQKGA